MFVVVALFAPFVVVCFVLSYVAWCLLLVVVVASLRLFGLCCMFDVYCRLFVVL